MNSHYKYNNFSKNYNSENLVTKIKHEIIPTLESVTSSEFRNGFNDESGFISNANDENDIIEMKNIDIKN